MALTRFRLIVNRVKVVSLIQTRSFHLSEQLLAGHSKWANIRHIKALKDGQKATEFTRLARQIRLAVQEGAGQTNPALNSILRTTIDDALKRNMPNARIQTILKKCSADNSAKLKKQIVELRALNKIFMVCIVYTDNPTATRQVMAPIIRKAGAALQDSRHLFTETGCVIAAPTPNEATVNSQSSLHDQQAQQIRKSDLKTEGELEEYCLEHAIECGAEEVEVVDFETRTVSFNCDVADLDRVKQKLESKGFRIEHAEHVFIPQNLIILSDAELSAYNKFKQKLQTVDGVEDIFDNLGNDKLHDDDDG